SPSMRRKYHLNSPLWPKFAINGDNVDATCKHDLQVHPFSHSDIEARQSNSVCAKFAHANKKELQHHA
ncbi:hypothetical protein, partial [Thiolapillus sp.]